MQGELARCRAPGHPVLPDRGGAALDPSTRLRPPLHPPTQHWETGSSRSTAGTGHPPLGDKASAGTFWTTLYSSSFFSPPVESVLQSGEGSGADTHPTASPLAGVDISSRTSAPPQTRSWACLGAGLQPRAKKPSPKQRRERFGIQPTRNRGAGLDDRNKAANEAWGSAVASSLKLLLQHNRPSWAIPGTDVEQRSHPSPALRPTWILPVDGTPGCPSVSVPRCRREMTPEGPVGAGGQPEVPSPGRRSDPAQLHPAPAWHTDARRLGLSQPAPAEQKC